MSSGIGPQLDLILSGGAEASVREEPQGSLQWEITTGLQTDAGRCWLWPFKLRCVCFYCTPAGNQENKTTNRGGKVAKKAGETRDEAATRCKLSLELVLRRGLG